MRDLSGPLRSKAESPQLRNRASGASGRPNSCCSPSVASFMRDQSARRTLGGGVVRDPTARDAAVTAVADWIAACPGWTVRGRTESPIAGGDGNLEYLLTAENDG